jgi:hypothetical protein
MQRVILHIEKSISESYLWTNTLDYIFSFSNLTLIFSLLDQDPFPKYRH